jgi:hypothetical protein
MAQEIVTTHIPMERHPDGWRADARAPGVMVKMAQAFTNAMQAARGATTAAWCRRAELLDMGNASGHLQ